MVDWKPRIMRNVVVSEEPEGMTVAEIKEACRFGSADLGSDGAAFQRALDELMKEGSLRKLANGTITKEHVQLGIAGWEGYAKMGDTYKLREKVREEMEEFGVKP